MKLKLAALLVGILLAATGSAQADGFSYGSGLKTRIPAPIPEHGAMAIPAAVPIPEGFTYYLRADLGWAFAGDRSYSETAREYGTAAGDFVVTPTISFADFDSNSVSVDDVFIGTIGAGAYFTRHIRGDLTLDFRGGQGITATGTYSYTADGGDDVEGTVTDRMTLRGVVGLANIYFDLLPRGVFTPYIGAGIGFVYNDLSRTYTDTAVIDAGLVTEQTQVVTGTSKDKNVALAGALMAGASFALGQTWSLDVGYRALYLGGIDATTTVNQGTSPTSRAVIGDTWEHQARIGLRFNIW